LQCRNRADEIGAGLAQRRGLRARVSIGGGKAQVFRRGHARRLLVGQTGQPDAHTAKVEQRAVLEVGDRRAGGIAQVRAIERKRRLRHAFQENRLAEIELVIARHENIRRDHVGERDDMRATVEPGHHRGGERVAAVRDDDVAPFGGRLRPLGLDDRCQAGESAAALPVGEGLLAHQIEVVEQHERDGRRVRRLRPGRAPADERERRGERGEKRAAGQHVFDVLTCRPLPCV
jgi:hypothetical protein